MEFPEHSQYDLPMTQQRTHGDATGPCLTFIGRTYEALGQRTEAADYFRKALARHPADHTAREGLARVTKKN